MADKILLNNKIYNINQDCLPCLITYNDKTGGSHFSVTMIANLFLSGLKILFFSAFSMAKDNFLNQAKDKKSNIKYITTVKELQKNRQKQAIILESGNEKLFYKAIKTLGDIHDRIVFIKNIETLSSRVLNESLTLQKIILSGDVDKCAAKKQISGKKFKTIVIFSKPRILLPVKPPILEKYTGYLWSDNKGGIVTVKFKKSVK